MTPPLARFYAIALRDRLLAVCLCSVALAAGHVVGLIPAPAGSLVLVGATPEAEEIQAIDVEVAA